MKLRGLSQKEIDFIEKAYKTAGSDTEELLHATLKVAATLSHLLAVVTAPKLPFKVLSSGLANIASQPEFSDSEHIKNILSVIENDNLIEQILGENINGR